MFDVQDSFDVFFGDLFVAFDADFSDGGFFLDVEGEDQAFGGGGGLDPDVVKAPQFMDTPNILADRLGVEGLFCSLSDLATGSPGSPYANSL